MRQQTSSISSSPTKTEAVVDPSQKTYTVKAGDDLWHIAENFYKSGYNWVDIAKANKLTDPGTIFSGDKLIIPNVSPKQSTLVQKDQLEVENSITGSSYTVKKGDSLWNIAVRAYADGYKWTRIANANNLSNPNLIFSGNVLKIPR